MTDMEKIESNWKKYSGLLGRFKDDSINDLLEGLGERLCIAPANPRKEQYGSYTGGLIDTSLRMASTMKSMAGKLSIQSTLKVALLHDIGRLGTESDDWLSHQDSDWHHERGFYFKQNYDLGPNNHVQRTLFFLQKYGVKLTADEFDAILSVEDSVARNTLSCNLLYARNVLITE